MFKALTLTCVVSVLLAIIAFAGCFMGRNSMSSNVSVKNDGEDKVKEPGIPAEGGDAKALFGAG